MELENITTAVVEEYKEEQDKTAEKVDDNLIAEKPLYIVKSYDSSPFYLFLKRILDIIFSLLGLVITSPIILIVALAIKIDSRGPVIYRQTRVGRGDREFTIYKFRSMVHRAEAETGAVWARKNDQRVTRIGRFIRKTRIDEIPQLWNILKGDMSLVGPRPERPVFVEEFENSHPGFKNRLLVKPGVTGLAQVNGGYNIKPHQKLRIDLFYIERRSIWLDLKILFKTVYVVIFGHGAR